MMEKAEHVWTVAVIAIVLIIGGATAWGLSGRGAFNGKYDDIGMMEVKETVEVIKSFEREGDFKFLIRLKVEEVNQLGTAKLAGTLPVNGDTISFDASDSRVNLFIDSQPFKCTGESAKVCQYEVIHDNMTAMITEMISDSSGLPEYEGTPK